MNHSTEKEADDDAAFLLSDDELRRTEDVFFAGSSAQSRRFLPSSPANEHSGIKKVTDLWCSLWKIFVSNDAVAEFDVA